MNLVKGIPDDEPTTGYYIGKLKERAEMDAAQEEARREGSLQRCKIVLDDLLTDAQYDEITRLLDKLGLDYAEIEV